MNKYGTYPVGHPQIFTNPESCDFSEYYGLAKIDIFPPTEFFNPVLPYHNGGILTFPLCRACVVCEQEKPILQRQYVCEHTDGECMSRGTWCTPEISKAVEKGYRIPKIHEVCHFP